MYSHKCVLVQHFLIYLMYVRGTSLMNVYDPNINLYLKWSCPENEFETPLRKSVLFLIFLKSVVCFYSFNSRNIRLPADRMFGKCLRYRQLLVITYFPQFYESFFPIRHEKNVPMRSWKTESSYPSFLLNAKLSDSFLTVKT